MLVIRLQRTGRTNLASYRVVVAEKARAVKGKFLEIVGHYLPQRDPAVLEVQEDRITHWMSKGAMPSDTLARLLKKKGMKNMDKFIKRYAKQKPRKAVEGDAADAGAAPAAAPAQAPAGDKAPAAA